MSATMLTWRWATTADPNGPRPAKGRKGPRVAHPLAARVGHRCRLITQSPTNGSRLVEFEDGLRVVAPFYATQTAQPPEEHPT